MLIFGIFAAVAVPRFGESISRFRAKAAANRIASDLMYARQEAMNQGVSQPVTFVIASNSYSMPNALHPDKTAQTYSVDLSSTEYPASITAVDFGSSATVTFDISGQPDSAGYVTVDSGQYQNTVDLDVITGRATVQ